MSNVNLEKMKKVLENGKKLIVKKVAPFALAATVVLSAGTMTAEAANVEFPNTEITYSGDSAYAKETDYKSSYVTDKEAKKIYETIEDIDASYNEVYTVMANGGMSIQHTGTKTNSMARLLASINEIENQYESTINSMNNTAKQVLNKYLTNKSEEIKLIYSNIVGISVKDVNDFAKINSCVFANTVGQSSLVNVGIYQLKNNQIVSSNIVSFNDTVLSTDKTLIKMPKLDVIYKNANSATPTFQTTYTGAIISKTNADVCRQAIAEIEDLYLKIEKAIEKGNYTKKSSQNVNDIYTSIYGDTNYINQGILNKYASYSNISATINEYLNYCQSNMIAKVYTKNASSINYLNYINYANNNKSMRVSEENGFVYYTVNDVTLYPITDRGYIKTSQLAASKTVVSNQLVPVQITASTGVNLYVDGQLFVPTDVNGNSVAPFVYNGTTYLPARAVSNLFGANIAWDSATNSVSLTAAENVDTGEYYINENGNKVYLNQSFPAIPSTNAKPNTQLTSKVMNASKGAKIYFNGNLFTPTDVNGNVVDVYVINGTTYLPARAVTTLFNTDIRWDATTLSVVINRGGIVNDAPIYDGGEYYYDENGNKVPVNGGTVTNPGTESGKAYYIDPNTGERVYIEEDEYTHTR